MKLFQLLPKKLHGFACNQPSSLRLSAVPQQPPVPHIPRSAPFHVEHSPHIRRPTLPNIPAPRLFRCVSARPARRSKSHGHAVAHPLPRPTLRCSSGAFHVEHSSHAVARRRPKSPAPGLFRCVSAPAPAPPDTPTLVSWHSARHKKSLIGASPGLYPCQRMWLSRRCPSKAPFMAYGLPQMTLSEPPRSIGDSPSHTRRTQGAYRAFCGEVCRKRGPGAPTARSGLFRCVQASAPAPKEPRRCHDSSADRPILRCSSGPFHVEHFKARPKMPPFTSTGMDNVRLLKQS